MKKKLTLIFLLIICLVFNVSAHEQLDDGWHVVKNMAINNSCKYKYVWAYYSNGYETSRHCSLIRVHRAWGEAPENSLEGIKMVKQKGYSSFEIDVRFTKDDVAVLSHDADINRIARNKDFSSINSKIFVKEHTLSELNNYIFVTSRTGKVLKKYGNNKITTFEEALKYSKENGLFMSIELKDGTAEQIKSLVKMVQSYKMDNKVNWLSFNPQLLLRVRSADADENLQLLDSGAYNPDCVPDYKTRYCATENERIEFHKILENKKNTVLMSGDKMNEVNYAFIAGANFPESLREYPVNKYAMKLINTGEVRLNSTWIKVKPGEEKRISYKYSGDGTIKCVSGDINSATCYVDKTNKEIVIKGINNKKVNIKVYATQGIKTSATRDYIIEINSSTKRGDVDADGNVSIFDYVLIRKHLLKIQVLTGDNLKRADIDGNGKVSISDYIAIRRIKLGI